MELAASWRVYDISLSEQDEVVTAGLSFGWWFYMGDNFFIEPSIRGGYPFIVGAALSTGLRF